MILDPVNSVTSIEFYRKVAKQSLGRSLLYLCYLSAVCSIVWTIRLDPAIMASYDWFAKAAPPLTFSDGKVSSDLKGPLILQHPSIQQIAVAIDTTRTEAVTPQMMEDSHVILYLTANSLYVSQQNGRIEVLDLARAPTPRPIRIDAEFYHFARPYLTRLLYPSTLVIFFCFFMVWNACAGLVYSLAAMAANAIAGAGLAYASLYSISVYAQTLACILQLIFLFMPGAGQAIPAFPLILFVLTSVYIWLAVKRNAPPAAAA